MASVKKKCPAAAILLLAGLFLWLGLQEKLLPGRDIAGRNHAGSRGATAAGTSEGEPGFRTKASDRGTMPARATHSPERLKEFILPPLEIDGLTLEKSLGKLLTAYQDACLISGETPLSLTFSVPPEASRRLRVYLKSQSFRTSVHILAALSGMEASRKGSQYRFEPLAAGGKSGTATIKVTPDFESTLNSMAWLPTTSDPFEEPVLFESLAKLGITLDAATLAFAPPGEMKIENISAADAAAITALAELIASEPKVQMKYTTRILELEAGTDWTAPDLNQMDDAQKQRLIRHLTHQSGVDILTMPTVTARNGQSESIEITREVIYPTSEAADEFETRDVGLVMNIRSDRLGFGQDLTFDYTETKHEGFDPTNRIKPIFNERTNLGSAGFSSDGGTRFSIQTRPDGSRALVLITSHQIDATGQPIR